MFHVQDGSHLGFGIVFEFPRLNLLVTTPWLVVGILQRSDSRFSFDLNFFALDFDIATARLVRSVFQRANFRSGVPLQLLRLDLYVSACV